MYRSTTSFTTKDYDVRPKQILEDDFTSEEQIQEFLRIGYIEVYDGTLEITENGQYDVEDYQTADVNVSGGEVNLQSKEVTITENGTTTIVADTGYDGLSNVGVTVNVSSQSDYNAKVNEVLEQYTGQSNSIANILLEIPELDMSALTSMDSFFSGCFNLEKIEGFKNMNNITSMASAFQKCYKLKTIPELDTSRVTNMSNCFANCTALESVPTLTSVLNVSYAYNMFSNCTNLKNVPELRWYNIRSGSNFKYMFSNCPNLTNESLNNILAMVKTFYFISSSDKTLKKLGLSETQATTCQTLSNWDAFVAEGWSTGY